MSHPPAAGHQVPPQPPKKSRAGLLVGVVALVLFLTIGGISGTTWYVYRQLADPTSDVTYNEAYGHPFSPHRVTVLISGSGDAEITWRVEGRLDMMKKKVALPWQTTIEVTKHNFRSVLTVVGVGASPSVQRCSMDVDGEPVATANGDGLTVQCAVHFRANN